MPWGDHDVTTELTFRGQAEGGLFERFELVHQVERDLDAIFEQRPVKRLIEVHHLTAYYHRRNGYVLVTGGRKEEARAAFRRLAHSDTRLTAVVPNIDLTTLTTLGHTTGGWFGKLQIAEVDTAGIFGGVSVVDSAEWERYSEKGEVSALYSQVTDSAGAVRTIVLTRERVIALMKDMGEEENLAFVAHVQELIDQAVSAQSSKGGEPA
jgi:hypothetical protein